MADVGNGRVRMWGWKGIRAGVEVLLGRRMSLRTVRRLLVRYPGVRVLSLAGQVYRYEEELKEWATKLLEVAEMMVSRRCKKCRKLMIRRHALDSSFPAACPYAWWCKCGHTEEGGMDRVLDFDAYYAELWALVNGAAEGSEQSAVSSEQSAENGEEATAGGQQAEDGPAVGSEQSAGNGQAAPAQRGRARRPGKK